MSDALVNIQDLQVQYKQGGIAVSGINLSVEAGEVLTIIGESGSGKSTTLHAIAGLLPASTEVSGDMRLRGRAGNMLSSSHDRRGLAGRELGMIFQNPGGSFNPVLRIGAQLDEVVGAHRGLGGVAARDVTEGLLDAIGLPRSGPQAKDWARAYPHQLSGGQLQRIAIAAALAGGPSVLLADEPTTALDATVQAQILDLLLRLVDELGVALVFVTHDIAVAASIGDRTLVLKDGRPVETVASAELVKAGRKPYTRALLEAAQPFTQEAGAATHGGWKDVDRPPLILERIHQSFPGDGGRRVQAVRDVSMTVRAGETVGLIGESGSGKTSLGRIAVGLARPEAGGLKLGELPFDPEHRRALVQMVFQDPLASFNPRQTIAQALGHPLRAHAKIGRSARRTRIAELMGKVGLDAGLGARHPHELSGGQLQRAAIARALAAGPSFLVCDEAVASLDVSIRAQVLNLLDDLREREGLGILFISHDLGVVQRIAHRTLVMYRGQIVEEGKTEAVMSAPRQEYTRRLIASVPSGQSRWREVWRRLT